MELKRRTYKPLGQLLIESGLLTQDQLEKGLSLQMEKGGLIGQILVSLGYVSEKDIAQAITVQYGFPYLPLENYDFDKNMVKIIPENVARQYGLVAIDKMGDIITVAMSNPLNVQAVEDIELITHAKIQIFVSTLGDIQKILDSCYKENKK
ncbi:MAG: hypothetical protein PHS37_05225 [Candidatus Omnitrophica bacterium]|nr:hypothetical protein [Candidatus Omnitrophota bacterium]